MVAELRNLGHQLVASAVAAWAPQREVWRVHVRLVRYGPRRLDSDNLAAAFKPIRDGIADALGVDDGSDRVAWSYEQITSVYGVEVVISEVLP